MRVFIFVLIAMVSLTCVRSAYTAPVVFQIQGDIPGVCQVTNVNVASTTTLDLNLTSAQSLGFVRYRCTLPSGFVREISSFNSGNLERAGQNIPYQLTHTGPLGLAFTATQLTSPIVTNHSSFFFLFGPFAELSVTIPSLPNDLFAGTYTDTITVVVTAN